MISAFAVTLEELIRFLKNERLSSSAAIAKAITEFGTLNPKAAYLATITPVVLEQNVSEKFLLNYKRELIQMTEQLGKIIHDRDGVSAKQAEVQFIASFNLFVGMWQHLNPPKKMLKLMEKHDLMSLQFFDFASTFRKMLDRIWQAK